MAPSGHWNDVNFLHDLVVAFYQVGIDANALTADMRKDIAARMKTMKHDVTWEGISFTNEQMSKIMDELRTREYTFTESALR
ncbi:uncharacterized protein MAM_01044 [Metarhizium album ARSEF 1941]|uniref:Uncharacterized protein n=1 Tax=Metarhizium album (strain ARSEF 1941) TaxID=1081103 RepID=A0A0B2X8D2_METAS|nr:uncharacterized protein MAM_01044 [Metarhizium album ARSEF 1941]KHO02043.1 hypothetical protein MAM_01044 [Metarhizium album ARSEF 1941]